MTTKQLLYRTLGVGLNALSFISPRYAGELTFALFAKPPKPNVRPKERAFLDLADRQDITWNGLHIPVYSWGPAAAPVVFCAYGWGYNAGRWRHYVPALNDAGYRVVAFDAPGHGLADYSSLDYPTYVALEAHLLRMIGGCALILSHSFGGGCLVEALTQLPREMQPKRAVFMGVFSEVRWIFTVFANSLQLRPAVFREMQAYIERRTGRSLDEFDVATNGSKLGHIDLMLVHDPEDRVTSYRNAARNHSHWPGSHLYAPLGAGHHLGTAEVTGNILRFLLNGDLPEGVKTNTGQQTPLPAVVSAHDLSRSGGVSDYYS